MQVNDRVEAFIVDDLAARPASKGQYGYRYALNCSRNSVVCHGMPSNEDVLQDGDIVNFDITLEKMASSRTPAKRISSATSRQPRSAWCA